MTEPIRRNMAPAWIWLLGVWIIYAAAYTANNLPFMLFPGNTNDAALFGDSPDIKGLFRALGNHGLSAGAVAALLAVYYGAGYAILLFRPKQASRWADCTLRMVTGMGTLSLLTQGLGMCGLYFGRLLAIVQGIFMVFAVVRIFRGRLWRELEIPAGKDRLPAFLSAGLFLVLFLLARTPIVDQDTLSVHVAVPEQYLRLHRIHAEPQHAWWQRAMGAQMLYSGAMAVGGIDAAKQVDVAALIVLLLLIYRLGRTCNGMNDSPWWPLFWVLSCRMLARASIFLEYYTISSVYLTAALWCVARGSGSGKAWWYAAFGFMGMGYGVNITAAFGILGICAVLALQGLFRLRPADYGWCLLLGMAPAFPWIVQSTIFTGNPVYPLFSSIFPSLQWGPEYERALHQRSSQNTAKSMHELRWYMQDIATAIRRLFGSELIGSPGLLALAPAAFLAKRDSAAKCVRDAALISCGIWLLTERVPQYIAPVCYWASVLVSPSSFGAMSSRRLFGWAYALLAVATFCFMQYADCCRLMSREEWKYVIGQASRQDIERDYYSTWYEMRKWTNENTLKGGNILLTGDARRVGFSGRIYSAGLIGEPQCWRITRESRDPGDMRKKFRQYGIKYHIHNYVMETYRRYCWFRGPNWDLRQLKLYKDFIGSYCLMAYSSERVDNDNGGFYVYRILDRTGPGSRIFFMPQTEGYYMGAWESMAAGDYPGALAKLAPVENILGDVLQVQLIKGTILSGKGDYEKAYAILKPGVEAGFVSIWGGGNVGLLGASAINTGRFDEGIKLLERAYAIYGAKETLDSIGLGYLARGRSRAGRGDISGAVGDVSRAIGCLREGVMKANARVLLSRLEMGDAFK